MTRSFVDDSVPDRVMRLMQSLGYLFVEEREADHLSRTVLVFSEQAMIDGVTVLTTITIEDTQA